MSKDFETAPELDSEDTDRPDPEEPATWQHEEPRATETDEVDWVDQHSAVQASPSDEDAEYPVGLTS